MYIEEGGENKKSEEKKGRCELKKKRPRLLLLTKFLARIRFLKRLSGKFRR